MTDPAQRLTRATAARECAITCASLDVTEAPVPKRPSSEAAARTLKTWWSLPRKPPQRCCTSCGCTKSNWRCRTTNCVAGNWNSTYRARYLNLYDRAPVGYCTVSKAGLVLEANLTLATLLGVARCGPFAPVIT